MIALRALFMSSFVVPWLLILYPIKIQPVLVGKATYIGSSMKLKKSISKPLLLSARPTIASMSNDYSFRMHTTTRLYPIPLLV